MRRTAILQNILAASALVGCGPAAFPAEQSPMADQQQQQQVIASPNPSVKEAETTNGADAPTKPTATPVKAAVTAKASPLRATASGKTKSKRRRARPRPR